VSLQGSLDTFALPDVLLLLASTRKSGELHVAGSRAVSVARQPDTEGRLWFDAGGLVGTDVAQTTEPAEAVFELLRLNQGTFSFLAGTPSGGGPRIEVEGVLVEAQTRLSEWREIEAVVPSLDAWLQLSPEPPLAHVSMRGDQWRLVVAIGAGCPVSGAIGHLGLAELPGCRAVKELVEAGLVQLTPHAPVELPSFWSDAAADVADPVLDEPMDDLEIVYHGAEDEPTLDEPAYEPEDDAYPEVGVDPVPIWAAEPAEPVAWADHPVDDEAPVPAIEPAAAGRVSAAAVAPAAPAAPTSIPDWRAEFGDLPDLDSVASLSSRRRPADGLEDAPVLGPIGSTVDDEDEVEEGDEPLNRGLLLKFLSSVRN
jgi:hypothetical protein